MQGVGASELQTSIFVMLTTDQLLDQLKDVNV